MSGTNQTLKIIGLTACLALFASCSQNSTTQDANPEELRANNIVGGAIAGSNFQKENGLVALVISTDDGQGICSGTLIAKRLVLTAAHCVSEEHGSIRSIAVVFALDVKKAKRSEIRYAVTSKAHEDYLTSQFGPESESKNDIALIKLNDDAPSDYKAAQLPTTDSVLPKAMLIEAGYGITEPRRGVPSNTSGLLRVVGGIELINKSADQKELLLKENNKGSCNGDSGGPAFSQNAGGRLTQVGVNSRGNSATTCIEVGIYTNVGAHLTWIKRTSAALMGVAPASMQPPAPPAQPSAPATL